MHKLARFNKLIVGVHTPILHINASIADILNHVIFEEIKNKRIRRINAYADRKNSENWAKRETREVWKSYEKEKKSMGTSKNFYYKLVNIYTK